MGELRAWLEEHDLGKYAELFAENEVDLSVLPDLTEQDLKDLGIPLGPRKKLLRAIGELADAQKPGKAAGPKTATAETKEAERRQLTVMFCDLVGSTELSMRLDPEDFREVVKTYQEACASIVARFEGHVAKYLGDGLLIYFGYPQAHEDDAERAVHAGIGIVEAVAALEPRPGQSLATRVGIATGRVVAGDLVGERVSDEQAVLGDVPNLAARLQGIAEPDTVVISDTTRRLAGGVFDYNDLGSRHLKGIAEPVRAWRAVSERAVGSRFEAHHGQLTEFVGREHEIGLLLDRWERAKGGEGQAILLAGEPGIGKSRIAQTLHERLGDDPHIRLRYQCSPHHTNSTLYPAIRQLEFAAMLAPDDTVERKLDKLEALVAQSTRAVADVMPLTAALLSIPTGDRYPALGLTPERQRERTLEALADLLVGLAARQSVLFVVEDAHWIDPTTRELLDLIIARVADAPVLVLITFRLEFLPQWQAHGHVTTLTLNRVTRQQSAAIITATGEGTALPEGLVDHIVEKSDGVPLFIEELTRAVLEAGAAETGAPQSRLAVPATLQDALAARLDRLAEAKEVAQTGAVIGREFSHDVIEAISPVSGVGLDEALDQLVRSELIFRRGTGPRAVYTFKHALVQETAYESLLKSRRREIHKSIAMALRERGGDEHEPELLAHHFTEAGDAQSALDYWYSAGERAVRRSANAEAVAHLVRGLDILRQLPDSRERDRRELAFQIMLGGPTIATRGYGATETEQLYKRARMLCDRLDETNQLFPVLYGQWVNRVVRAEHDLAESVANDFLTLAEKHEQTGPSLVAHRCVGLILLYRGRPLEARKHLEQVLALYDADEHRGMAYRYGQDPAASTRGWLSWVLWLLGFPDQARASAEEGLASARELGHAHTIANTLGYGCMMVELFRRDPERVLAHANELLDAARDHGFAMWRGLAAIGRGWAKVQQGEDDAGLDEVRSGLEAAYGTGEHLIRAHSLCLLVECDLKFGDLDEAARALDEAFRLCQRAGAGWWEAELRRLRGLLLLATEPSRPDAAESELREAIEIASAQGARALQLRATTDLAQLLSRQNKIAAANELLAPIYNSFDEGLDTRDLTEAKALLDALGTGS